MKKRVCFLDKDGTIVDNPGYPVDIPSDNILDNVKDGMKYLQSKGFHLIIVSNQPWIAKGRMTKEEADDVFKSVQKKLREDGIVILDYFYCPHQSLDNCDCKKPKPKMILDAVAKHDIDLENSLVVGDMDADILLAKNLNIKSVLVKTGKGKEFVDFGADYVIENLNEIGKVI